MTNQDRLCSHACSIVGSTGGVKKTILLYFLDYFLIFPYFPVKFSVPIALNIVRYRTKFHDDISIRLNIDFTVLN